MEKNRQTFNQLFELDIENLFLFSIEEVEFDGGNLKVKLYKTKRTSKGFVRDYPDIEVSFEQYISLHIDDESYAGLDKNSEFIGSRYFRIYSKSSLLTFVEENTFAKEVIEDSLHHYEINTENKIISIVTSTLPEIKESK